MATSLERAESGSKRRTCRGSAGVDGCRFVACFYDTLGFQGICCLTVQRGTGKTASLRIKTTS